MASAAPATMTARTVVMMTPDDKRAIEKRAHDYGVTPSEWIRRAAKDFEPIEGVEEALLEVLADEIEATVGSIRRSVAEMQSDMAFHRAEMERIRRGAGSVAQ